MKKLDSTRGSGNIFADLGFPPEEAAHLFIRSTLMIHIRSALAEQGLTQKCAAKILGVSQPRVSDLYRRKLDRFSIDMLVRMLARLGITVEVKTKRAPKIA
jgi:predicted XRE-type DNA-binding protein